MSPAAANGSGAPPPRVDNLSELIATHVRERPERVAVGTSDLQLVLAYHQLDELVRSASAQLAQLGVRPGDLLALISDNHVEFVVGLLALFNSGAMVAPLNPALTLSELQVRLAALPVRALLVPQHHSAQISLWGTVGRGAYGTRRGVCLPGPKIHRAWPGGRGVEERIEGEGAWQEAPGRDRQGAPGSI